jgi:hypothetical protein
LVSGLGTASSVPVELKDTDQGESSAIGDPGAKVIAPVVSSWVNSDTEESASRWLMV